MTFDVILCFIKKMRLRNVSINRNINQNRFINECTRKKKLKSCVYSLTVSEFTTTTDFQGPKETLAQFLL